MTQPIKIGIIGYRGFGAFCTDAFHSTGRARVVAFAGRDQVAMAACAEQYDVPFTFTNWQELVDCPDVELVHIVTPPDMHAEMAIAAINAGKHVLIEKPMATSTADAARILEAVNAHPECIVGVNYVMRYNPLYALVSALTKSGCLGKLTHVSFQNYASDEGLGDDHWFWKPEEAGGIFIEHGVHFFDIVGSIIDSPPTTVFGQTWNRTDATGKEDRVQANVTYKSGATATYYHAFNRPGLLEKQLIHFAFELGHIDLAGWNPNSMTLESIGNDDQMGTLRGLIANVDIAPLNSGNGSVRGNGIDHSVELRATATVDVGDQGALYSREVGDALVDILDKIGDPGNHTLRVTTSDGALSLAVAVAAARSAASGRIENVNH